MKNIVNCLEVVKQRTFEKTGLAEFTEYNPRLTEEIDRCKGLRKGIEELTKNLDKQLLCVGEVSTKGYFLAQIFSRFGEGRGGKLGRALDYSGDWQQKIEELRDNLSSSIREKLTDSIKNTIKEDIDKTKAAKKRLGKIRAEYDAIDGKLNKISRNSKDAMDIMKQHEEKKKSFFAAEQEATQIATEVNMKIQRVLMASLTNYWQFYFEFFERGYMMMKEVKEKMNDVALNYDGHSTYARRATTAESLERSPSPPIASTSAGSSTTAPSTATSHSASSSNSVLGSPALSASSPQRGHASYEGHVHSHETSAVDSPSLSENKHKLFGVDLKDLSEREALKGEGGLLPEFIEKIFHHLNIDGPTTDNIFKVSGSARRVTELKEQIHAGVVIDLDQVEVHTISQLLKVFLRELPEPLLTYPLFKGFQSVNEITNDMEAINRLKKLTSELPPPNRLLLGKLLSLCNKIVKNKEKTKVDAFSLAIVLGPNILHPKDTFHGGSSVGTSSTVVSKMITYYEILFPKISSELDEAIRNKDVERVRGLIAQGTSLAERDTEERTALHLAAEFGSPELITLLLRYISVNAVDLYGMTPLHRAVVKENKSIADLLIENGANLEIRDFAGLTVWDKANLCTQDMVEVLKDLCKKHNLVSPDKLTSIPSTPESTTPRDESTTMDDNNNNNNNNKKKANARVFEEDDNNPMTQTVFISHQNEPTKESEAALRSIDIQNDDLLSKENIRGSVQTPQQEEKKDINNNNNSSNVEKAREEDTRLAFARELVKNVQRLRGQLRSITSAEGAVPFVRLFKDTKIHMELLKAQLPHLPKSHLHRSQIDPIQDKVVKLRLTLDFALQELELMYGHVIELAYRPNNTSSKRNSAINTETLDQIKEITERIQSCIYVIFG